MSKPFIFVSHSSADKIFADALVHALRMAGADVWYDEHNLGPGHLLETINREIVARPIFIVILSEAAFSSAWVKDECQWAYTLYRRQPSRIILPITSQAFDASNFDHLLFMADFKRVEAPGYRPYPRAEAIERTLHMLALNPTSRTISSLHRKINGTADDLITYGKALSARSQFAEAILFLERAAILTPGSTEAWANLGNAYEKEQRLGDALRAYSKALALDGKQAWVWFNKGRVLYDLGQDKEALAAIEQVLLLNPFDEYAWYMKGNVLNRLKWHDEARTAFDRAHSINPNMITPTP